MTVDAYRSFSPTIADIVDGLFARGRVDAPGAPGRRAGAFNYSAILPGGAVETFVFMNYQGARRDVATLAHECGHAAHGVLAGQAQGPLMFHAPMAYAETASVFGERVAFGKMRADVAARGDAKEELALVMAKLDDTMNTVIRQIAFSNFERRLHAAADRKLSVQELCAAWLETTKELYGEDGDVFTYEDMDHLWAYVSHFHRPFYVYSYAFGEMLTQGLFAKKDAFGERFEPMYLDLLRAGATKNAKELLAPFGLDPDDPKFWSDGIASSFGALIEDAERLCDKSGVKR
jgi:oligoendopeptidase F